MLTGCAQDLIFSDINRDTVEVLARNGCEVITPPEQSCCGSLHAHNGEWELAQAAGAKEHRPISARTIRRHHHQRRRLRFASETFRQAAGRRSGLSRSRRSCGTQKVKDIHEWLMEIGVQAPVRVQVRAQSVHGSHFRTDTSHSALRRDLPRVLPPLPRTENHRAAARIIARDSESEAGGIARKFVVLRQRRHLQYHPARNGGRTSANASSSTSDPPAPKSSPPAIPAACCN